jgi:hypothetical protein
MVLLPEVGDLLLSLHEVTLIFPANKEEILMQ